MAPIDPAALTAATLLATPVAKGTGAANASAALERLTAPVQRALVGEPAVETTLANASDHPDDPQRLRALAELLDALAARDTSFGEKLAGLISQAQGDSTIGEFVTQVHGHAQVGKLVTIGHAGEIHVHLPPKVPSRRLIDRLRRETRRPLVANLPPRNPAFTGRQDLLDGSASLLAQGTATAVVQPQALHGLGGVGKTQLALEYAHRHAGDFDVVWWVVAEPVIAVPAALVTLARRLGIEEAANQEQTVAVLLDELRQLDRWLLVFDNADQADDLTPYWPTGSGGRVLVTSRNPGWDELAGTVRVDVLTREEAVTFLNTRTGQGDQAAAAAIAEALGDLPLALEQAAAYIKQATISLSDYLGLLRLRAPELLALGRSASSKQTVATTWAVSLDRLKVEAPVAQDLLTLCAFLGPDNVPRALLPAQAEILPEPLQSTVADPLEYNRAIAALGRYSLVTATSTTLSAHRLVQMIIRDDLAEEEQRRWVGLAVQLISAVFPGKAWDVSNWSLCAVLSPHALAAVGLADALGVEREASARLLNRVGEYVWGRGELQQARILEEQALRIREAEYGPDSEEVAYSVANLAVTLRDLGDLAGARAALERALRIYEAHLGADNPTVAKALSMLGTTLRRLGDLAGARTAHERALKTMVAVHGADHPDVATAMSNLGATLVDLKDYAEARTLFERVVEIYEAEYGAEHPEVATSLHNLGVTLAWLRDLAGARAALERALGINEALLGADHPTTRITARWFASLAEPEADNADAD